MREETKRGHVVAWTGLAALLMFGFIANLPVYLVEVGGLPHWLGLIGWTAGLVLGFLASRALFRAVLSRLLAEPRS